MRRTAVERAEINRSRKSGGRDQCAIVKREGQRSRVYCGVSESSLARLDRVLKSLGLKSCTYVPALPGGKVSSITMYSKQPQPGNDGA
jgi:hypothetical protein